MKEIREQDGEGSEIKGRFQVLVFRKDDGCGDDAIDRFKVCSEVEFICAERAEEAVGQVLREDRAHKREDDDPQPVQGFVNQQRGEAVGIEDGNRKKTDDGGS